MAPFDAETKARRLEGLRLARISSAMEGMRTSPEDATALDAFTRGDITEAEFIRRVSVPSRTPAKKWRYGR